jgi:hypothetical protein
LSIILKEVRINGIIVKYFLLSLSNLLMFFSCDSSKGISPIFVENANFLVLNMSIEANSPKNIVVKMSMRNISSDSILLYEPLFPISGNIVENVFSIISNETLDRVKYMGPNQERHLFTAPDDDKGVVIPRLDPKYFIKLLPHEVINLKTNLARYYDFNEFVAKGDKSFFIAPDILLPAVSFDYKHSVKLDSADQKEKLLYYQVTLPHRDDIDSMRVYFKL